MNYEQSRYSIELDYADLGEGETQSGVLCPACEGGASKEKSLSVSRREGFLLWNCHRASCSFGGSSRVSATGREKGSDFTPPRQFSYITTTPLNSATAKFLATRYGIPAEDFRLAGCGWTGDGAGNYGRRVSFPIFGPDSRKRGENYRSYEEGVKPKSLIKLANDEAIAQCWYKWKRKSPALVLVEDQVSAIKVAKHAHSIALLGTNLSEAKLLEIMYSGDYDRVYLALDADATMEAIKTQLKWRERMPTLMVLGLHKDIKDMDKDEFTNFLERLN